MKVLFLTVSPGEGHNAICKALAGFMKNHEENVETKIVDIFKGRDNFRDFLVNKAYFALCRSAIHFANACFELFKKRDYRKEKVNPTTFFVDKRTLKFIQNEIDTFCPDIIFCAHMFPAVAVAKLRHTFNSACLKAKTYFIVSDFDVPPCTELLNNIDYIFVPNNDFREGLINKGFDEAQIIDSGIPVDEKFAKTIDKEEIREKLNLKNIFTALVMSGGDGLGNNYKLVKNLRKSNNKIQIVTVSGRNTKQFKLLEKYKSKNNDTLLTNYAFVNNVDELMSASDIVITKMGGLTTSEAFSKDLPIISTKRLPFQENNNKNYLLSKNACLYIEKEKKAYEILDNLLKDQKKYNEMKNAIKFMKKEKSSEYVCKFMLKQQT